MYRIRFLKIMLKCFLFKPSPDIFGAYRLRFRALPFFDTDFLRLFTHTYTSWTALGRWHYVFSSPFRGAALRLGWFPVTTAETMTFKKSIKAGARVDLKTEILCWNEKCFFIRQTFTVGETIYAVALSEGIVRQGRQHLNPIQVFEELGFKTPSPAMPDDIRAWSLTRNQ